jgi:hypothetical protein
LIKKDLNVEFDIEIIGKSAELSNDARLTKQKLTVLLGSRMNPIINPVINERKILEIAGFEPNEINDLLDTTNMANKEVSLQSAEESQKMLKEDVQPNRNADTAHIRKHLEFVQSNELKPEVHDRIIAHMKLEVPIARNNMVDALMYQKAQMGALPEQGMVGQPMGQTNIEELPDTNLEPQPLIGNV